VYGVCEQLLDHALVERWVDWLSRCQSDNRISLRIDWASLQNADTLPVTGQKIGPPLWSGADSKFS